jgi:hypothetical protein
MTCALMYFSHLQQRHLADNLFDQPSIDLQTKILQPAPKPTYNRPPSVLGTAARIVTPKKQEQCASPASMRKIAGTPGRVASPFKSLPLTSNYTTTLGEPGRVTSPLVRQRLF